MARFATIRCTCTLHRWVFGSNPDFYPKLGLQGSLIPVKKFPTNLIVSEVDLSGPVHRNLQKFQGKPRMSGLCCNPYFFYWDSEGGRKESLEKHSV